MICYLCGKLNIDKPFAYAYMSSLIQKDMQVSVMNLVHDEEWASERKAYEDDLRIGSGYTDRIRDAFEPYMIPMNQIHFLRPFQDETKTLEKQIRMSDILYLHTENRDDAMAYLRNHDLVQVIRRFEGLLITDAGASMLLTDTFESFYDPFESIEGIGLFPGLSLDPYYAEDEMHLGRMIRVLEDTDRNIAAFNEAGGMLIGDGYLELTGESFVVDANDLDRIYQAYEDAKSRREYYGDNGNW